MLWPPAQVLFTLSKEKLNTSWKYAMAVIILDFLQVSSPLPGVERPGAAQAQEPGPAHNSHSSQHVFNLCAAAQRVQLVPMVSLGIQ